VKPLDGSIQQALFRGTNWLVERIQTKLWVNPAPIGFYFAKLWYFEQLYPIIFTTGALSGLTRKN